MHTQINPETSIRTAAPVSTRSWIKASLIVMVLFALAATASLQRKPASSRLDEVAHLSYVAHAQATGLKWSRFADMRMLDPETFQFGAEQNYLNHPPFYYWLIATIGPQLLGRPESVIPARALNIALVACGLAALLFLARRMQLAQSEFYAFAAMVAATPVLAALAGSVNNDNFAFFGGAVSFLGLYLYAATSSRAWLIVACGGMLAASAAKLTGFLLVGTTLALTLALMATRRRPAGFDLLIAACSLIVASSPYLVFVLQYGSPAPNTPAQSALLANGAAVAGWASAPRMTPAVYAVFFLKSLLMGWIVALPPLSALDASVLALPAAIVLISLAGLGVSIRALIDRRAQPTDFIVVAGMGAIALTLAIHIAFSYKRHLQTGWMLDAYPRYYLPLIPVIPIATLALTSAVRHQRLKMALVSFLVAAPIVLFGRLLS
jgi:4-amino-4-deoxy-L-arabinose transferase-like glycosyltransferase